MISLTEIPELVRIHSCTGPGWSVRGREIKNTGNGGKLSPRLVISLIELPELVGIHTSFVVHVG